MGSTINIDGAIVIYPPIPWALIRESGFLPPPAAARVPGNDLMLRVAEVAEDTEEGTLLRRTADGIVSASHDESRAAHLLEEVQAVVDEFGDGRTFTGRLDVTCPDHMEMWRIKVIGGTATRFDPVISWPGDSE